MAKHKKTLEQKKKMDAKKHTSIPSSNPTGSTSSSSFSLSGYTFSSQPTNAPKPSPSSVSLTHGLEKSLVVSSVIVILQLAFFFFLTHHILILPLKLIQY